MARGAPDGTLPVLVTFAAGQAAEERAAGDTGRYSGGAVAYQTVAEWTVAAGYTGELKEIIILSSLYTKTYVKITIGSVTYCEDWITLSSMPLIFEDLRLAAA